jgi:rubrerythrin
VKFSRRKTPWCENKGSKGGFMSTFKSTEEILDFAIASEEDSYTYYTDLAGKMENTHISTVFRDFAVEELGHKEKLLRVRKEKVLAAKPEKIMDLKIADYLVPTALKSDMEYQDILMLAMQKEKAAFRLYMTLSERVDDENLRNLFLFLAQEEAKHKLRFELEYDEHVLKDN